MGLIHSTLYMYVLVCKGVGMGLLGLNPSNCGGVV